MKRLTFVPLMTLPVLVFALAWLVRTSPVASAAPAWGANCLSCHSLLTPSPLTVARYGYVADPAEGPGGGPDRGPLKTFVGFRGRVNVLRAHVAGLQSADRYAVQLQRLRFPGVSHGGRLDFAPDCTWPEWGDGAPYYTNPAVAYGADSGPSDFAFEMDVAATAPRDFYDLVFAVGGKGGADDVLFYGEEHFYLRVVVPGDLDDNGVANPADFAPLARALAGPGVTAPPAGSTPEAFALSDLDADGDVDVADGAAFQRLCGGN
jgi:hypothetical protein